MRITHGLFMGDALVVRTKPWQSGSLKRVRLELTLVVCQMAGARLAPGADSGTPALP